MKENEKNLFYRVLSDNIKEEPSPDRVAEIMRKVNNYAKKRIIRNKILEILGYSVLGMISLGLVFGYLIYFTDFKLPVLHFSFETPSKIYIIILSFIFVFLLIQLYFRQRLYETQ